MHQIIYTEKARLDLHKLDARIAQRIIKKVKFFGEQASPLKRARKITDPRLGTYRFRVGDYRVLFDVDGQGHMLMLYILRIKHRKDIYNL